MLARRVSCDDRRAPICAVMPFAGGERRGAELRDDAAFECALVEQPFARPAPMRRRPRPRRIGRRRRSGTRGASHRGRVRAQRQRRRRSRSAGRLRAAPRRAPSPRQRGDDRLRSARQRVADAAERRHRHGEHARASPNTGTATLAERRAQLCVDRLHRLADDIERGARGAPPAGDEFDRDAARCISWVICGPAPCTTTTSWPSSRRPRIRPADSAATAPPTFTTRRLTTGTPR